MAALVEQLPRRMLFAATALAGLPGTNTWSAERTHILQQEVVARFHYESRVSAQVDDGGSDEYEFEAMPLVAVEVVRVRFRDIGQLPPPSYFKDEPVLDD